MEYFKKFSTEDKILAAYIGIIFLIHIYLFSSIVHVPGPIYGGDLYRERGFVQYLVNGGEFYKDPYFQYDEYAFYPPLGYLVGSWLVQITSFTIDQILIFLPAFLAIGTSIGLYLLGKRLLKDKVFALFVVFANGLFRFVDGKHTYAMGFMFLIFTLYFFLKTQEEPTRKNQVITGIFIGLTSLSHYQTFIFLCVFLGASLFVELIMTSKKEGIAKAMQEFLRKYLLIIIIGIIIASIFFGPVIWKYHLKTLNETQKFSLQDIDRFGLGWLLKSTKDVFINGSSIYPFIQGLFATLGLIFVIMNIAKSENNIILTWLIGIVIAAGHFLITKPLFNTWVVPGHILTGIIIPQIILIACGVKFLFLHIKKHASEYSNYALIAIVILFIIPNTYAQAKGYNENNWVIYGRQIDQQTGMIMQIGDWILHNTNPDEVFIANDESAFALNALTGRPVLFVRRTHASPYADVDKRYADGVVILYGKNQKKQRDLLTQYHITYFFADSFLVNYPIIVNKKYESYLKENGVSFSIQNVRLDPSTELAPSYPSLVVPFQELSIVNITKPFMQFKIDQKNTFAVIYKI